MAGRIPARIRVHTATPLIYGEGDATEYAEGERGSAVEPTAGAPFACVIFLPGGGEQAGGGRLRTVTQPTMLYNPTRDVTDASRGLVADQSPVVLSAESEVSVLAAELAPWTGAGLVSLESMGEPRSLGPVMALEDEPEVLTLAGWSGAAPVRFQLVGAPQPLGPPGNVVAVQATIRQIRG